MEERQSVDMVRIPRAEEYFDRDEVLGRDAASVFPNESRKVNVLDADKVKEMIGATNFISETQLEELKAAGRARVEDGVVSVDKSLAEVLAENKAKKDAEFKQRWEMLKQGKNKPLEVDEVEFLDTVLQAKAEQERAALLADQQELDAFREALQQRVISDGQAASSEDAEDAQAPATAATKPAKKGPAPSRTSLSVAKPVIKPRVKVRPKAAAERGDDEGPPGKKLKSSSPAIEAGKKQAAAKAQPALPLLLGDYGSDSADESS